MLLNLYLGELGVLGSDYRLNEKLHIWAGTGSSAHFPTCLCGLYKLAPHHYFSHIKLNQLTIMRKSLSLWCQPHPCSCLL